jgi:hypothetical protein
VVAHVSDASPFTAAAGASAPGRPYRARERWSGQDLLRGPGASLGTRGEADFTADEIAHRPRRRAQHPRQAVAARRGPPVGQLAVNAVQYLGFQRFRVGGIAYTGLKAEMESVDALSSVLLDVYRLDSTLRGLGERPTAGELQRARALVAKAGDHAAERFARVRTLQAGSDGGDPVGDAAAAWDVASAPILERLSPGAPFDGRSFTALLDGPQRVRYARLVEALDDASGQLRQRALQFEEETNADVRRAVVVRLVLGVSLGAILLVAFLLVGRAILRPISSLVHLAERVGQGDLSCRWSCRPPPATSWAGWWRAWGRWSGRCARRWARWQDRRRTWGTRSRGCAAWPTNR